MEAEASQGGSTTAGRRSWEKPSNGGGWGVGGISTKTKGKRERIMFEKLRENQTTKGENGHGKRGGQIGQPGSGRELWAKRQAAGLGCVGPGPGDQCPQRDTQESAAHRQPLASSGAATVSRWGLK